MELVSLQQKQKELVKTAQAFYDSNVKKLQVQSAILKAISPEALLDRGYALVTKDGHPVSQVSLLKPEDLVQIQLKDGAASAVIEEIYHGKSE